MRHDVVSIERKCCSGRGYATKQWRR